MGNCCQSEASRKDSHPVTQQNAPGSDSPTTDSNINNNHNNNNNNTNSQKQQLITDTEDEKLNITNNNSGPNNNNNNTKNNTKYINSDEMALAENSSNIAENNNNNNNSYKAVSVESNSYGGNRSEKVPILSGNIDRERYLIYKNHIIKKIEEDDNTNTNIVKVTAKLDDSEEKDEIVESIIATYVDSNSGKDLNKEIELTCSICMDDELTPSQLVEYTFDNETYFLANICPDCCEYYRSTKFENWKTGIENETCEAALRRLMRIGVITHLFDNVVFASPEEEQHLYQVKDHNGKTVQIPRPVSGMRLWNASKNKYDVVPSRLIGAPDTEEELQELWHGMIQTLKTKYGPDLVSSWQNESTPGGPNE